MLFRSLHELPDKGKFTIIVSYMSYKTREMVVDVAKKDKVDIPMDEDLKQLGEVVVTGHREYRSDRSAIESVKNAGNVLNVMSHVRASFTAVQQTSNSFFSLSYLNSILVGWTLTSHFSCGRSRYSTVGYFSPLQL